MVGMAQVGTPISQNGVAPCREFRFALPWESLYTDDLVVRAETEDDLIKRLHEWRIET